MENKVFTVFKSAVGYGYGIYNNVTGAVECYFDSMHQAYMQAMRWNKTRKDGI